MSERMPDARLQHGQRSTYQAGCACTPCRAAEAAYRAALRRRQGRGLPPLGSLVPASDTWQRIRAFQREGLSKAALAHALGLKSRELSLHPVRVRLRTALKVRRLYRQMLSDSAH